MAFRLFQYKDGFGDFQSEKFDFQTRLEIRQLKPIKSERNQKLSELPSAITRKYSGIN